MANTPIEMSKLRQILKLHSNGMGKRKIADRLGASKNTVKAYLDQLSMMRISPKDALDLPDLELNTLFNAPREEILTPRLKALYDYFPMVEKRLSKRGVTRIALYNEYRQVHPDGFSKTQFYFHFKRWSNKVTPTLRIEHVAGDRIYIDFAGQTLSYVDEDTGEILKAQVFVAILGWSQYGYVEALRSQEVDEFIGGCENAFHFFGGVPLAVVPDNLKSAVTKPHRYEPDLNENFKAFVDHYGTSCVPARVRKPQDKAHVENLVKLIYQRIYTQLSPDHILTLKELNKQILQHLREHNEHPIKGIDQSRSQRWVVERHALQPLADQRFELRTTRRVTVMKNCHVLLSEDKHYYSAPHELVGKQVKLTYSRSHVWIYDNYLLVAQHSRVRSKGNYTTERSHLPPQHQHVLSLSPEQYIKRAQAIDPAVKLYISMVLDKREYPQQAYKSCDGILSLEKKVGRDRLIKACQRGHEFGQYGYKVIENILKRNLERMENQEDEHQMPKHENVRADYR
jgi:transposase